MSKQCTKCKEIKLLTEYSKQSKSKDGLTYWCKPCISKFMKARNRKQHKNTQNYYLKRLYGISKQDFDTMSDKQNHSCKICKKPNQNRALDVDHCHISGKVRGLLCNSCNRGLGYFQDDANLLIAATQYLNDHEQ